MSDIARVVEQPLPDGERPAHGSWLTFVVFGIVVLLIVANWQLVPILFGTDYFSWYLKYGSGTLFGFTLFSLAWNGIDKHVGLISANPRSFYYGYFTLYTGVLGAMASAMSANSRGSIWNTLLTLPFGLLLIVAIVLFTLLITPLQYVQHLITGAPARAAVASVERTWMRVTPEHTEIVLGTDKPSPDAVEAGFSAKPVALTSALDTIMVGLAAVLIQYFG